MTLAAAYHRLTGAGELSETAEVKFPLLRITIHGTYQPYI